MAHNKVRNFTDVRLKDMEKYFKKYFEDLSFIEKLAHYIGSFNIKTEDNYKQYIRSLGKTAGVVNSKVATIYKGIKIIEKTYKGKITKNKEQLESYKNMIDRFSSAISFENFSTPYNFNALESCMVDDYLKTLSSRVDTILEKNIDDLTDEDIEILAYCYSNCSDDKTREKILNYFSEDVTDKHVTNKSTEGKPDIHYYEMNEKFQYFNICAQYYYEITYEKYLNGECSEADFNTAWQNYYVISNFDTENYFWSENGKAITIKKGQMTYNIAKYDNIVIDEFGGIKANNKGEPAKSMPKDWLYNKYELDTSFAFYEPGASSQSYLENKMIGDNYSDDQIDWGSKIQDKYIESVEAGADAVLPGSGKVIKKVVSTIEKIEKIDGNSDKDFSDFSNSRAIGWFQLKLIDSGNGKYYVVAGPNSKAAFDKFKAALNNYPHLKEKYKNVNFDDFANGRVNYSAIFADVNNNDSLRNDLGWY